jgi:SpoVK/Ycf46/Vps4 family AAA+-type ATPase
MANMLQSGDTEIPFENQEVKDKILSRVAQVTHSFVPADLQNLCRQVVLMLVQQDAKSMDSTQQVSEGKKCI